MHRKTPLKRSTAERFFSYGPVNVSRIIRFIGNVEFEIDLGKFRLHFSPRQYERKEELMQLFGIGKPAKESAEG